MTGTATERGIYAKLTDSSQYTGQYRHRDYGPPPEAAHTEVVAHSPPHTFVPARATQQLTYCWAQVPARRTAARAPTGESKVSRRSERSGGSTSGSRSRSPTAPRSAAGEEEAKAEPGPASDAALHAVFTHFAAFGLSKVQQEHVRQAWSARLRLGNGALHWLKRSPLRRLASRWTQRGSPS